jgi:hypothetical protein
LNSGANHLNLNKLLKILIFNCKHCFLSIKQNITGPDNKIICNKLPHKLAHKSVLLWMMLAFRKSWIQRGLLPVCQKCLLIFVLENYKTIIDINLNNYKNLGCLKINFLHSHMNFFPIKNEMSVDIDLCFRICVASLHALQQVIGNVYLPR